jgi:hypothetical protein
MPAIHVVDPFWSIRRALLSDHDLVIIKMDNDS